MKRAAAGIPSLGRDLVTSVPRWRSGGPPRRTDEWKGEPSVPRTGGIRYASRSRLLSLSLPSSIHPSNLFFSPRIAARRENSLPWRSFEYFQFDIRLFVKAGGERGGAESFPSSLCSLFLFRARRRAATFSARTTTTGDQGIVKLFGKFALCPRIPRSSRHCSYQTAKKSTESSLSTLDARPPSTVTLVICVYRYVYTYIYMFTLVTDSLKTFGFNPRTPTLRLRPMTSWPFKYLPRRSSPLPSPSVRVFLRDSLGIGSPTELLGELRGEKRGAR